MAITITGILAGMVAVFIRGAVDSYFDTARRAELTDISDTALRRISRDLRLAVPNTARTTSAGGIVYLELLLAKAGGRYVDNETCFTAAAGCTSVTSMGSVVDTIGGNVGVPAGPSGSRYLIAGINGGGDRIVIYNQYNNFNNDCAADNPSAYCGDNTSLLNAATPVTDAGGSDVFNFAAKKFVPLNGSPTRRFQIFEGPVTYACNPAAHTLTRHSGYAVAAAQPTPPGGTADLIATNVANCNFDYAQGVFERWGVVGLYLELSRGGETVSLYHEVHVNNTP